VNSISTEIRTKDSSSSTPTDLPQNERPKAPPTPTQEAWSSSWGGNTLFNQPWEEVVDRKGTPTPTLPAKISSVATYQTTIPTKKNQLIYLAPRRQ